MSKATVMAVVNQKGGTGKTTTCENLGIGLAKEGKRVLLVDTDPQASLVNALAASDQVLMVDSNLQRENILPSERAFAYKMKLEAIKHQGERTDLTFAFPKKRLR